jgi:hypothetical protein
MPLHGWVHDAHCFYGNAEITKKIGLHLTLPDPLPLSYLCIISIYKLLSPKFVMS